MLIIFIHHCQYNFKTHEFLIPREGYSISLRFASFSVIIGKRDANAINPKPSIKGERPGTLEASPIPNAAINGTVTVEVVTPPESYVRE